jgi:hypothetical protein
MVLGAVGTVTLDPTGAPTAYPTLDGYAIVHVEKVVTVVEAALVFAVSEIEALDPVMQAVLSEGFADAIGLPYDSVRVSAVGSTLIFRRLLGRRLASTEIKFAIQSASSNTDQVTALRSSITAAATEGSIVANVQKKASSAGVLTANLKSQTRQLAAPTMTQSAKTITVPEAIRSNTPAPTMYPTFAPTPPTKYPTLAPTAPPKNPTLFPTLKPTRGEEEEVVGSWWGPVIAMGCLAFAGAGCYLFIYGVGSNTDTMDKGDNPVRGSQVEDALEIEVANV